MKLILQRVNSASVIINQKEHSSISKGYLIYLAISKNCTIEKIEWMTNKILNLRVFANKQEKGFQKTIEEVKGEILIVSQFTLFGDCSQGTKPKFNNSGEYYKAKEFYEEFISTLNKKTNLKIKQGEFGAKMEIISNNDGPITLILEK